MSSMDTMLAGVLKKALPPEVMELLTAEKIKEISEGINAYIVNTRDSLERIEAQNYAILKAVEELTNDGHNSSGEPSLIGSGNA